MANKIKLALFKRRNLVLVAVGVLTVVAGAAHGHFPPAYGLWDGPL